MKISFDLHGVLEECPPFFRSILLKLKEDKHEIFVLSGPPAQDIINELTLLGYLMGVHYDSVLSIVDYLTVSNVHLWLDKKNTWWADDESWWSSKSKICKLEEIDIHFDDHIKYGKYFNTHCKFVHLDIKNLIDGVLNERILPNFK